MINIYVIQILLILFFGLLFRDDKKKFLRAAFIILFAVMAFRNARMVGNDSATSYFGDFVDIQTADLQWPNIGLPIVMKIIRYYTDDYQWVIIITAAIVCFAYYKLLLKYSENGFISVMWFMGMLFYTFLFSAFKQAWAMAFLCFAFDAVFEKKLLRFIVFVGLSTLFHFPAIIFLPAYWIARLKINRAFPILMFSVLAFVFIFRAQLLNLMVSTYAKGEGDYSSNAGFFGTKFVFMVLMILFGLYQYYKHKYNTDYGTNHFSVLLYFMGIAAIIQTFCLYDNVFERLADYYYQFSILFVPLVLCRKEYDVNQHGYNNLLQAENNSDSFVNVERKRVLNYTIEDIDIISVLSAVITVFCVWRFVSNTTSGADSLSPYYFFWQGLSTSL